MQQQFKVCFAFLFLVTSLCVQGQENEELELQELDEVVVSDSRFELKRENSGKTVIKINQEELQKNQGRSLAEIINNKSGIELAGSRGRQGEILGVFARGGRGRQVLVVVDGVRVIDPSSFSQVYDLRLLSVSQIESIEIIKGASSTLYGTNAATAVINIVTKSAPEEKIAGEFQSSIGTNQTAEDQDYNLSEFQNSARIGGSLKRFTYSASFAQLFVNGISSIDTDQNEEDATSRYSTDVSLGYRFKKNIGFRLYANQTNYNTEYDESFGLIDAPYRFISEQKRLGLSADWKFGKGELALNTAVSDYASENISAFPNAFSGKNYIGDLFLKYVFDDSIYTIVGLNYLKDQAEFTAVEDFTLIDPYANLVYVSDFGLNINGGFRLNNHSEYGTEFVYNINPSYVLEMGDGYLKFLASYATSYITPSLTQLFGEFGANPDLEPENDRTIEGGIEYANKNGFRVNAIYFDRREENFVFFDNIAFQYLNAENTIDAQGVEFELNWKPLEELSITANYTFTERMGDNAIRIPRHKVNATVTYNFTERSLLSLAYAYTGKRSDTDFSTFSEVDLDPFSLFGLLYSYQLIENKMRVYANLENIFNSSYTEVIGFNTRGRNIRIGFALNL